jgi:hypothetical protein
VPEDQLQPTVPDDLFHDLFQRLDPLLQSADPAASLDYLIAQFLQKKEYGLVFEAHLMKKRHDLGLPLIQTDSIAADDYQQAVMDAARETGRLFLADGRIERAWPYFRAVSETQPIYEAIDRLQPEDNMENVIAIAFQEGVHPLKGLELILAQHGMCRAITAFGMTAVQRDREGCISMLAKHLRSEIVSRIKGAIEARESAVPETTDLIALMQDREWLFAEWDYYVDTSHLLSVLPYCAEIADHQSLLVFADLCEYGKRLAPQFKSPGIPPFEDQFTAYGHYVQALLGNNVDEHLDYFRRQIADTDPEVVGDAPGRHLARLLISLNRPADALNVVIEHVFEDSTYGAPVPSALQLCYQAKEFSRLKDIAKERGDLLSYAAGSILSR